MFFFKAKWILLHLIIILGTANVLAVFCSLEWIHGMFPPGLRFWWVAYRGKGNFIRCISSLRRWNPFKLNTRNLAETSFWAGWNGGEEVRVLFVNGGWCCWKMQWIDELISRQKRPRIWMAFSSKKWAPKFSGSSGSKGLPIKKKQLRKELQELGINIVDGRGSLASELLFFTSTRDLDWHHLAAQGAAARVMLLHGMHHLWEQLEDWLKLHSAWQLTETSSLGAGFAVLSRRRDGDGAQSTKSSNCSWSLWAQSMRKATTLLEAKGEFFFQIWLLGAAPGPQ